MPTPDDQKLPAPRRRGLGGSSIRRGAVARWAIRSIRLAQQAAWHLLELVLALVILFEEWGWQPLAAALARLARFRPIARLEAWVGGLPPYPALAVFLTPSLLFLPLKLAAIWLIAGGYAAAATALFVFAKVAGTALYARIFQLTHPALMRLGWFARLYNWFVPWKEALIAHVRQTAVWQAGVALKTRAKAIAAEAWMRLRPGVEALARRVRGALGF